MKVSIVTVVYNRKETIASALESVLSQTYSDVEYIVVDGASTDGTCEIIEKYKDKITRFISESDKGMYDALNKAIKIATGEVVGILHSDDVFSSNRIIEEIAAEFKKDNSLDCTYGDVAFVNRAKDNRIVRYYSSANFSVYKFAQGFMPAHTSFFCKKRCFDHFGYYDLQYSISSDFDLLVRFLGIQAIKSKYIPLCTTYMAFGGKSTSGPSATFQINQQFHRILRFHNIKSNYWMLYSRYFRKLLEFFQSRTLSK